MIILLVILAVLAIILFLPIPLIIDFEYENSAFLLRIYNIKIDTSKILKKRSTQIRIKKAKKKINLIDIKNILSVLSTCRLKPRISFNLDLGFGLDDAALTGFTYGIIWCIYPVLNYITNIIFTIKECKLNITPYFNDKLLKFDFHGIIVTSLAKAIYIFLYTFIKVNKNY